MVQCRISAVTFLFVAIIASASPSPAQTGAGAPATIETRSGMIDVEGGKLAYEVAGKGDTLVMIHDGLLHKQTWDDQWIPFAERFTVVRYDRRGFGQSPKPTAPYSNVRDLATLFDSLHIHRATLMGMSAGGGLSIDFALAHPDRVDALVLVGAVVSGMGYTNHMFSRGGHLTQADIADREKFKTYWIERDPYEIAPESGAARERIRALLDANPQDLDDEKGRLAQQPDRPALAALGEIKAPTLILVGEFDIPDVHAHAGAIEAGIPHARRVIVNGAGHLIPLEQPKRFNNEVFRFLLGRDLVAMIEDGKITEAQAELARVRREHDGYIPVAEDYLNACGYRLVQQGRLDDAITVFRMNVESYPESWNVYDSLGEAYAAKGETAKAIDAYAKSIELNPQNENGKRVIEQLGGTPPSPASKGKTERSETGERAEETRSTTATERETGSSTAGETSGGPGSGAPPYLGQPPPGEDPCLFAPGIVSTGLNERDIAITPDGNEIYFTVYTGNYAHSSILCVKRTAGGWTQPEVAPFSGSTAYLDGEPCISPDGMKFFFVSGRPRDSKDAEGGRSRIWVMDRVGDGWGEPHLLELPAAAEAEDYFPSVTRDGTLYFTRSITGVRGNKIWRSRLVNGSYGEPVELPAEVNTGVDRYNAFIAQDESYVILGVAGRSDGRGGTDYYVSFRGPDDSWSEAVNLGEKINTAGYLEYSPYVSLDGKYFFFMSARAEKDTDPSARFTYGELRALAGRPGSGSADIYWVDAEFLQRLRPR